MVGERERGNCIRLQNPLRGFEQGSSMIAFVFLNILDIVNNSQYGNNSESKKANDLGADACNLI